MKKAFVMPTGDEIQNGIVVDCDSPEIMGQLIRRFPEIEVTRLAPLRDGEETIKEALKQVLTAAPDLVVFIGGSGGGHRHSPSLGMDYTQSALESFLSTKAVREIYGKNGHLWCKLLCGKVEETWVINVPGPFAEAKAAMEAFLHSYSPAASLSEVNEAMALAVYAQYPAKTVEKAVGMECL